MVIHPFIHSTKKISSLFKEYCKCPETYQKFFCTFSINLLLHGEKNPYEDTEDINAGKTDSVKFAGILPISE